MAAQLVALGPVTVGAPGTPVGVQTVLPTPPSSIDVNNNVHSCIIEALSGNTGKVYIGLKGMNKSSLAGVLMVLPVPTANSIPTFSMSITFGANAIDLADLYIDADIGTNGVLVTALVA